ESNVASAILTSAAPQITLAVSYGAAHHSVTLSGCVTDEDPGGRTVTFSGMVNATVTTNADGTFSLTVDADGVGAVQATTADPWGQASNMAHVTLTNQAPVISDFEVIKQFGGFWTVRGQVQDENPAGLTVRLGGMSDLEGQTATVDDSGW